MLNGKISNQKPKGKARKIQVHGIRSHLTTKNRWHAKLIIKIRNGKPYALIVGSSNLTSRAFEYDQSWYTTNFECDVVIYPNEHRDMFDKTKYPNGTFLSTRPMNLKEIEELSKTFIKEFLESKVISNELAEAVFDKDYLKEVKKTDFKVYFNENPFNNLY